jgi:hypothetical protein
MKRNFPRWVMLLGLPAIVSVWLLAVRLVWEQTAYTWENGEQMVGRSLIESNIGALLVLAVMASLVWPILMIGAAIWAKHIGGRKPLIYLGAYLTAWALILTPYGVWQRVFIDKFSPAQAANLMTSAAAKGDIGTVDAFLRSGVAIDAQGPNGTALHTAAIEAELGMMAFLLARGADVNALNDSCDSPMENARRAPQRSAEALDLLAKHGGRLIRGSEDPREKFTEAQLREAINQMGMPRR